MIRRRTRLWQQVKASRSIYTEDREACERVSRACYSIALVQHVNSQTLCINFLHGRIIFKRHHQADILLLSSLFP
jgi:hypothetical protein